MQDLGQRPWGADQRDAVAPALLTAGRQPAGHRVGRDLTEHHQPGEQPRHRRQAALDGPRRQPGLPVREPHDPAITARLALVVDEREHVGDDDLGGYFRDDGEERPQVRHGRQDGVAAAPCGDEQQIAVEHWMPRSGRLVKRLVRRQNTRIERHGSRSLSAATTRPNDEPAQA